MTRQQLADRAGVSWATVVHVEIGQPGIQVSTLCAVGEAAGLDIVLRAYPGRSPSLHDTGQLQQVRILMTQAHRQWQPQIEVAVGPHGQAIDMVLFGAAEIQAHEVERMATDFQAQLRRADEKRMALAAKHQRPVRLVMVIEDTTRNRAAVAPHLDVVRARLPAGPREVLASLRSGGPLGKDGLLWLRARRFRSPEPGSSEGKAHGS